MGSHIVPCFVFIFSNPDNLPRVEKVSVFPHGHYATISYIGNKYFPRKDKRSIYWVVKAI